MKKYHISQDQYQSSIYTVAFMLVLIATIVKGELIPGFQKMFLYHGTVTEIDHHRDNPTYTRNVKCLLLILFTFTGLFGSSCAGAITKHWGALRMSVTSTVRKAGTLFLSMAAPGFHNKCTPEHFMGICIFISALFVKSLQKGNRGHGSRMTMTKTTRKTKPTIISPVGSSENGSNATTDSIGKELELQPILSKSSYGSTKKEDDPIVIKTI